jgi:hypothetical protein
MVAIGAAVRACATFAESLTTLDALDSDVARAADSCWQLHDTPVQVRR